MEELAKKVNKNSEELAEHRQQIKTLFESQKEIKELTESTYKLATSVEKLAMRADDTDKRLSVIENTARNRVNIIWACVATGIIGATVTYIMAAIL